MLENFQLAALVGVADDAQLYKIPLHRGLQVDLANRWEAQLNAFSGNSEELDFDPAYNPEENETFRLNEFDLPAPLAATNSENAHRLGSLGENEGVVELIKAIIGIAENDGDEIVLFQNFSRSHVIRAGQFLFLQNDTYETVQRPGLTLDGRLSAIYWPGERKLLFHNFRTVNTFLPLADIYREASEGDIREVLGHERLAPEDADALAVNANQWFRKRFALLRDSGILDEYTPRQLQTRSRRYGIAIRIAEGKVVFPSDRAGAKRLLQFLNEEIFRGAVTENLYETNSKRKADT
jgi:hypothetical protein